MRNGVAHGGIVFLDGNICYKDKHGNEATLSDREAIAICDDLVDTSNAIVLALTVFLISNQHLGYQLPKQLLIDELKEETKTPWWEIVGCTPSKYGNLNQLLIHVKADTYDFGKISVTAFQSAYLAELFAPGFDRYFFSIRGEKAWPGFVSFDGIKMRNLRLSGDAELMDYQGVVENNLIFYVPHLKIPQFLTRLDNFLVYFRVHWPQIKEDIRRHVGLPSLDVREARIHRNSWGCVLNGTVVVSSKGRDLREDVRKSCGRIIKKALSHARKHTHRLQSVRYLPLGFARISIFSTDHRLRQLSGLGEDLVCTIQLQRIRRIQAPDILGATIERRGRYRIAWNRAWLESQQSQQTAAAGQAAAP